MRKIIPLLIITLVANLIFVGACKKPRQQADEDPAVYKKRLTGIYLGKAAVGLRAVSDATAILYKANKLNIATATSIYNVDDRAADALQVIANRLQLGFADQSLIEKLDTIVSDIQTVEDLGVLDLTDTAKNQFEIITGGARAALAALRAVLISQQEPDATKQALAAKRELHRAKLLANKQWVMDLVQVVLIAYGDAEALNNQPTVDGAFNAVAVIIQTVKALNAQRRAELV